MEKINLLIQFSHFGLFFLNQKVSIIKCSWNLKSCKALFFSLKFESKSLFFFFRKNKSGFFSFPCVLSHLSVGYVSLTASFLIFFGVLFIALVFR